MLKLRLKKHLVDSKIIPALFEFSSLGLGFQPAAFIFG